ncbi:MMS19 nucleotide excision repair protein homolog [Trachemys scripta elegans]|uniref:MMS19 nucleotide excision repair protein homolog n=1 Tax=Trachemys scripta elegans TaxID=31138 RepID=UPI0015558318|nr:MMS19 nucleotide excision repair protein homolog [Trachemys scripta elegans]
MPLPRSRCGLAETGACISHSESQAGDHPVREVLLVESLRKQVAELQEEVAGLRSSSAREEFLECIHMETSKAEDATQLQRIAVTPPGQEDMALSQEGYWLLVTSGSRQCFTPTPNPSTTILNLFHLVPSHVRRAAQPPALPPGGPGVERRGAVPSQCGGSVTGWKCHSPDLPGHGSEAPACLPLPSRRLAAQSVSQVVPLFLDGEVSFLPQDSFPCPFQPFQGGQHVAAQRRLVALLMAFVCSLPRNVPIPQQDRLLQELLALSCSCDCPFTATAAAKCFAGLVNKYPPGQQLDQLLETAVNRMEAGLAEGPLRTQALALLLWVTKALVLRYHPLSSRLTDKLLGLLGDAELGPAVADGFSLLMADSPDVLHKGCHADVRIMFRQRFFTDNVPKLVQGFHAAGPGVKANYLKGLSHVLNHLPRPVLVTELPTLLSLLLEALSCPDCVVQLSTLNCLQPLLLEAPHVMSLHVDTLVTKFLGLTSSPAMAIRIAALQCVHALTSLPIPALLPYKPRVIRALAKPLDDMKRLVRKEAVVARGEWFLLGSPGR